MGIPVRLVVGIVLCGMVRECGALSRDDVLFYAPFEGSLTAEIAAGGERPVGDRLSAVEYVAGVIGRAVVTGTSMEDLVAYPVAGHLNERRGVLSLWFRPVDGRSGDAQPHVVFSIGGRLLFYHYWEGQSFCFWWMNGSTVLWGPGYLYETVTPDQWQHVVASWADGKCTIYWNGKPRAEAVDMPVEVPPWTEGEAFRLAQPDWTRDRNNRTAIDELMISRNPLSAQEARGLYRHGNVELPGPELRVTGGGPA